MTPAELIHQARADGVTLGLKPDGSLKAGGLPEALTRWLPTIREHKAGIVEALAFPVIATSTPPARRWFLYFPDRHPVEIFRSPPATLTDVLVDNPGTIAAEPVLDQVQARCNATSDDTALIRSWLASIGETDATAINEVLTKCGSDPEALDYFMGQACDQGHHQAQELAPPPAAHSCRTCQHFRRPGLSGGYCNGDRPDLAHVYGAHHTLRQIPADNGKTCGQWRSSV